MTKCLWCRERLTFVPGRGWLHPNGELYKTFVREDGETRDDHCARPVPDDAPCPSCGWPAPYHDGDRYGL